MMAALWARPSGGMAPPFPLRQPIDIDRLHFVYFVPRPPLGPCSIDLDLKRRAVLALSEVRAAIFHGMSTLQLTVRLHQKLNLTRLIVVDLTAFRVCGRARCSRDTFKLVSDRTVNEIRECDALYLSLRGGGFVKIRIKPDDRRFCRPGIFRRSTHYVYL